MRDKGLEGWCAMDTPEDGYISEGELDVQKLVGQQNKKKNKSGCGFQALGLSAPILKGITRKGYKNPTPIQRRSIPPILEGKDVVAMARTGSGKTAAFLIPLFERLKVHSSQGSGIRGLILSPTRELALQTLSFAKQLGRFTSVRAAVVLGGDSMELQFQALTENPDIVIATPGRFMHVCIQMSLKLSSVDYVVFDEADRLFEMGFSEQLRDIISRLSTNRQTVLFSATLPKMMVEFARAGLSDPVLIRLDVENKISENLSMAFFKVRPVDRVPLLLHLLKTSIDIENEPTVIFVPTKHHVEHLHLLLEKEGVPNTYTYSSLDPAARKINVAKFRNKKVNVLLVTDIAARGIDIPLLDNVINFNFPARTKLFIHRVGRVARAGRKGYAYSFVSPEETGYLLELHMFINKAIKFASVEYSKESAEKDWNLVYGTIPLNMLDDGTCHLDHLHSTNFDLEQLRMAAENGYKKYLKSCVPPSHETIRRLKREMWEGEVGFHPFLLRGSSGSDSGIEEDSKRFELLGKLRNNRPRLTIFEVKQKSLGAKATEVSSLKFMTEKRKVDEGRIEKYHRLLEERKAMSNKRKRMEEKASEQRQTLEASTEVDLSDTFAKVIGNKIKKSRPGELEDSNGKQHFIPYEQADRHTEEALAVRSNFERDAAGVSFDLVEDSGTQKPPTNKKTWDRVRKKFVGLATQTKRVKTESGVWVNATYTKDLYSKWKLKSQQKKDDEDGDIDGCEAGVEREVIKAPKKTDDDKKEDRFVTLNPRVRNQGGKKHPLLAQKESENWAQNTQRKRKAQQVKTNRELYTYEEKQKNIKHKKLKQMKQTSSAQFHKKKRGEEAKKMWKKQRKN